MPGEEESFEEIYDKQLEHERKLLAENRPSPAHQLAIETEQPRRSSPGATVAGLAVGLMMIPLFVIVGFVLPVPLMPEPCRGELEVMRDEWAAVHFPGPTRSSCRFEKPTFACGVLRCDVSDARDGDYLRSMESIVCEDNGCRTAFAARYE